MSGRELLNVTKAALSAAALVAVGGCGPETVRFALRDPIFRIAEMSCPAPPRRRNPQPGALSLRREVVEPVDRFLRLEEELEARNVNAFDLVPDSSWFTARLGVGAARDFYAGIDRTRRAGKELSAAEMARGGATSFGPSMLGRWQVVAAGRDRRSVWLMVTDVRERLFVFRFDHPRWPGLATSAQLVATKLLYAAGYNVPERHMVIFKAKLRLELAPGARYHRDSSPWKTPSSGWSRSREGHLRLTRSKLEDLLDELPTQEDGSARALATRVRPSRELGPFPLVGRRPDDPNDRIDHQHRRELRGLRLLAAWLDLSGLDELSGADLYRAEDKRVIHVLRHFAPALGAGSKGKPRPVYPPSKLYTVPHYMIPPPKPPARLTKRRARLLESHPAVGWLGARGFRPDRWAPKQRHPGFVRATRRDLFWAGRILAGFDRKKIAAAVSAAFLEQETAQELVRRIWARGRLAARYGLSRCAPLGFFRVSGEGNDLLCFTDLWRESGLGKRDAPAEYSATGRIPGGAERKLAVSSTGKDHRACVNLARADGAPTRPEYLIVKLRRKKKPRHDVDVHLRRTENLDLRVVGVRR
jgi:hypothetical protein